MIVCRMCMTRYDDDPATCANCSADLTGERGLKIGVPSQDISGDLPMLDPLDEGLTRHEHSGAHAAASAPTPKPLAEPPAPTVLPELSYLVEDDTDQSAQTPDRLGYLPEADPGPGRETSEFVFPQRPASGAQEATKQSPPVSTAPDPDSIDGAAGHRVAVRPGEGDDEAGPDAPNVGSTSESRPTPERVPLVGGSKRAPQVGEVACARCRQPNPLERRFCLECGGPLPALSEDGTLVMEAVPPPDNWWRKLTRTTAHGEVDRRTWRQRERDSGQAKAGYSSDRTLGTRLATVGLAALLAVLVLSLIVFRGRLFGSDQLAVNPAGLELTGLTELSNFPAERATDGSVETAFGLAFEPMGPQELGIQEVAGGALFNVVLSEPMILQALEFNVAFENGELAYDPALFPRVHRLAIVGLGQSEIPIILESKPGAQRIELEQDLPAVERFTVRLDSVYHPGWATNNVAVFVEIGVVEGG